MTPTTGCCPMRSHSFGRGWLSVQTRRRHLQVRELGPEDGEARPARTLPASDRLSGRAPSPTLCAREPPLQLLPRRRRDPPHRRRARCERLRRLERGRGLGPGNAARLPRGNRVSPDADVPATSSWRFPLVPRAHAGGLPRALRPAARAGQARCEGPALGEVGSAAPRARAQTRCRTRDRAHRRDHPRQSAPRAARSSWNEPLAERRHLHARPPSRSAAVSGGGLQPR